VTAVDVLILHPEPDRGAGPLTGSVAEARRELAEIHRRGFLAVGARTARIVAGPADDRSFGARIRDIIDPTMDGGIVMLGSGAVPLATSRDRRRFVEVAASDAAVALSNNWFSSDIVAIARAGPTIATMPDLATDNALPRWLAETRGYQVTDLRGSWRLGIDIDGPLDLVLIGRRWREAVSAVERDRVMSRLDALRSVATDPLAEIVVAGRTSPGAIVGAARTMAARTRALIEERGMRTRIPGQRPAASVLGALLDHTGPDQFGDQLARLGEAAIIDTRVLLAHRLGADERGWPSAEDRFASDMLLHERIADPWLRDLTRAALDAPISIVLGGHTLVGPGLRLALRP
jgi:hypothetical protein